MYTKILVALDNSPISELIFQRALSIAQPMQSQLLLVHGLTSEEEGSPLPLPRNVESMYWAPSSEIDLTAWRESWSQYASESLNRLRHFSAIANAAQVNTEFRQIAGTPGSVICKIAREWGADLVVVGNRGRSGLAELLLGSVSNYVLHRAPCSVLVIKQETTVPQEPTERMGTASVL